MNLNISNIKKIFIIYILMGIVLFSSITILFYNINNKANQMLKHRTLVIKNLSYIKYHIAETHLWLMEYIAGDKIEKDKIYNNLSMIDEKLNLLINFEKNKYRIIDSKFRDNKTIYNKYLLIQKNYHELIKLVEEHLIHNHMAGSEFDKLFDTKYANFIKEISLFEEYLNQTFQKVNSDFATMKNNMYILIFIIGILGLIIAIVVMRNEILKIQTIIKKEKELKVHSQNKLNSISTMLSNIAHQWRQPLSVITTTSSGMQLTLEFDDKIDNSTLKNNLDIITDQSKYLSNIIEDFQSFFQNTDPIKNKTTFNIKDTIDNSITILNDAIISNKIQLILDLDNCTITNNETQLKQVFLNILKNSIESLEELENRYIFISIKIEKEEVIITFKDSGNGVSEETLPQLYEPYFTTKHQSQGTGLGLYFVFEVITKHFNGNVKSQNTTFTYEDKTLSGLETKINFKYK